MDETLEWLEWLETATLSPQVGAHMDTYGFPVWMFSEPGLSVGVWIASIAILTVFTVMVWWWAGKALPPAAVVDTRAAFSMTGTFRNAPTSRRKRKLGGLYPPGDFKIVIVFQSVEAYSSA